MCNLISKQLLGISIAAALIFTTTGCGSSSTTTKTSRQALPESIQNLSFDEHLNISVGYWNIEEMEKAAEPDAMTQYIEDLFNITLEPIAVTWSNYKERYQILSATGSLPDVFATLTLSSNDNNDSATFSDFINTGAIRALPEDLTNYPHLNEVLDSVSYTKYTDGKYYAIPRVSFLDPVLGATDAAMLVRRDWMDSLGISDPESFQDFADIFFLQAVERVGLPAYGAARAIAVAVSAFLAAVAALAAFLLLLAALRLPEPDLHDLRDGIAYLDLVARGKPMLYFTVRIVIIGLACSFAAEFGLMVTAFFPNAYVAILSPILLYYLQEILGKLIHMEIRWYLVRVIFGQTYDNEMESFYWAVGYLTVATILCGWAFCRRMRKEQVS